MSGFGGAMASGVAAVLVAVTVLAAVVGWMAGRSSTAAELRALRWAATHDLLTGLANRVELCAAVAGTPRGPGRVALMVLDLDGFKGVNDVYGHAAGDAVLVQVARRLQCWVRSGGSPATLAVRLSGDEFAVVLALPENWSAAEAVAHGAAAAVHRAVCQPYVLPALPGAGPAAVVVGISIGIAMVAPAVPGPDGTLDDLFVRADAAMYEAKSAGGGWRIAARSNGWSDVDARRDGRAGASAMGTTRPALTSTSEVCDAETAGGGPFDAPRYGRRPAATPLSRRRRAAGPPDDDSTAEREAS